MRAAFARRIVIGFTALVLIVLVLVAGMRAYLGGAEEERLRPDEDVAITQLRGPLPQNAFIACPQGYCTVAEAMTSPVFTTAADRLFGFWMEMIAAEPRVVQVAAQPEQHRYVFMQRTPVLRFPDIVIVEFIALAPDRSSLAIYSRSRYGRYDFGVNRRRVVRWLSRLQQLAGAVSQ